VKYLLDTDAWVAYLRGEDAGLIQILHQTHPNGIALCTIVLAELIHGAYRSGPAHFAVNSGLITQHRQRVRMEIVFRGCLATNLIDIIASAY
jgi:predicted nucleic acid-binding protein